MNLFQCHGDQNISYIFAVSFDPVHNKTFKIGFFLETVQERSSEFCMIELYIFIPVLKTLTYFQYNISGNFEREFVFLLFLVCDDSLEFKLLYMTHMNKVANKMIFMALISIWWR